MRFDAHEYVDTWKATGRYPAIHDDIFHAIQSFMCGKSALDLCCSTGLLGTRVLKKLGVNVIGLDADTKAVDYAKQAGIPIEIINATLARKNMKDLAQLCQTNKIDTLLARRCMPELFGDDLEAGRKFSDLLSLAGIKEIFIEGRISSSRSVNNLSGIKQEVELFTNNYKVARVYKNVAYLRSEN